MVGGTHPSCGAPPHVCARFGDTVTTFSHGWNRWDTGYVSAYMVLHLILLYAIHTKHPTWVKYRHSIVSVDRICSFIALAQVRVMTAICTKIDVSVACAIARPGGGHVGTIFVYIEVMGVGAGSVAPDQVVRHHT